LQQRTKRPVVSNSTEAVSAVIDSDKKMTLSGVFFPLSAGQLLHDLSEIWNTASAEIIVEKGY